MGRKELYFWLASFAKRRVKVTLLEHTNELKAKTYTKRLELAAIVHTYNEERNIEECLESLRWVDELIVVDMYSTDKTLEIARRYTDKIYLHENVGIIEPAKNFSLSKVTKDWALYVDADERVSQRLKEEIIEKVLVGSKPTYIVASNENSAITWQTSNPCDFSAYYVPVTDYMFGRWVQYGPGSASQQRQTRLVRPDKCYWPPTIHSKAQIKGVMSLLEAPILHFSHLEIFNYITKLNRYTNFEAQQRFDTGKHYSWFNTLLASLSQFYNILIKQKAYKEGSHGLILTILLVFYTFVYRAKLWELHYKARHPDSMQKHEPFAEPQKVSESVEDKG